MLKKNKYRLLNVNVKIQKKVYLFDSVNSKMVYLLFNLQHALYDITLPTKWPYTDTLNVKTRIMCITHNIIPTSAYTCSPPRDTPPCFDTAVYHGVPISVLQSMIRKWGSFAMIYCNCYVPKFLTPRIFSERRARDFRFH